MSCNDVPLILEPGDVVIRPCPDGFIVASISVGEDLKPEVSWHPCSTYTADEVVPRQERTEIPGLVEALWTVLEHTGGYFSKHTGGIVIEWAHGYEQKIRDKK